MTLIKGYFWRSRLLEGSGHEAAIARWEGVGFLTTALGQKTFPPKASGRVIVYGE